MTTTPTPDAAAHVLYVAKRGGYPPSEFAKRLLAAWDIADDDNAARLAGAFPEYAAAFALLRQRGGIERLHDIAGA